MAGLNCGITIALLGVLLLNAALPPLGVGECGAAEAGGAEWLRWPASRPRQRAGVGAEGAESGAAAAQWG